MAPLSSDRHCCYGNLENVSSQSLTKEDVRLRRIVTIVTSVSAKAEDA